MATGRNFLELDSLKNQLYVSTAKQQAIQIRQIQLDSQRLALEKLKEDNRAKELLLEKAKFDAQMEQIRSKDEQLLEINKQILLMLQNQKQ